MRMKITTTAIYFEYYSSSCILKMLYFDALTFLKKLMLIKQANQKSLIFVTIGNLKTKVLNFNQMSAMDVMIY